MDDEYNIFYYKPDGVKTIYYECPAKSTEHLREFTDYKKHLTRCRSLQGKKGFLCHYNFAHVFLEMNLRNQHEDSCWAKALGAKKKKIGDQNMIDLGKAGEKLLLSEEIQEFDENQLLNESTSSMMVEENSAAQRRGK